MVIKHTALLIMTGWMRQELKAIKRKIFFVLPFNEIEMLLVDVRNGEFCSI